MTERALSKLSTGDELDHIRANLDVLLDEPVGQFTSTSLYAGTTRPSWTAVHFDNFLARTRRLLDDQTGQTGRCVDAFVACMCDDQNWNANGLQIDGKDALRAKRLFRRFVSHSHSSSGHRTYRRQMRPHTARSGRFDRREDVGYVRGNCQSERRSRMVGSCQRKGLSR